MDILINEKEIIEENFKSKITEGKNGILIHALFALYKDIFGIGNIKFLETKSESEHFFDYEYNLQKLMIVAESYFITQQHLGKFNMMNLFNFYIKKIIKLKISHFLWIIALKSCFTGLRRMTKSL